MSAGASGPTAPQGSGPWARSAAEAVALRAADRRPQSEARRQTNRRWTRRVRHQQRRRRFRCWWALLEQAAGAEGIVVAGAATPPHEPSETEFEGHAAFLASAESVRVVVVAALVAGRQECADHQWSSWLSAGPARLAWTSLTS